MDGARGAETRVRIPLGPEWARSRLAVDRSRLRANERRRTGRALDGGSVRRYSKGSSTGTPARRKSAAFRLTTVSPCTRAVAAISPSTTGSVLRAFRRPHSTAMTSVMGSRRSPKPVRSGEHRDQHLACAPNVLAEQPPELRRTGEQARRKVRGALVGAGDVPTIAASSHLCSPGDRMQLARRLEEHLTGGKALFGLVTDLEANLPFENVGDGQS